MKTKLLALTFLSLIAAVLLAGCSGGDNPNVTKANFEKLNNGMIQADVVAILGQPSGTETIGELNRQPVLGQVWRGKNTRIVVGFDSGGKLVTKRMD